MPRCQLCLNEVPALINAHIIPRSFWEIDVDLPPLRLVTNTAEVFPKRIPAGVYDSTIVCEGCERRFSPYDDYAAELFLHRKMKYEPIRDTIEGLTGYIVRDFNYKLLKLFAISLIWRAAVSSQAIFGKVQLGPFGEKARQMLINRDPGDPSTFSVLFSIWDNSDLPLIMDPFQERWDGVRSYRFYLGRMVAYIKVDQRPFPAAFAKCAVSPDGPLNIVSRNLLQSNDFAVVRHVSASYTRGRHKGQGR